MIPEDLKVYLNDAIKYYLENKDGRPDDLAMWELGKCCYIKYIEKNGFKDDYEKE